ncbi:hypothetical protein RHSIM_Rhsim06G0021600 [Rhododendron simsii]|uniref:Uncharacterized protein n=1 Tax=Rhododendron simsii TaxID=118357 RepID=A0A834H2I9_RHOSS|nr:hypothetical protein RHSIM_Rhsim06G0021600 [Rhododendron simsii]
MGTLKGSNNFAFARRRWGEVFVSLLNMIETQKTQIEYLLEKTDMFEDRLKSQRERFQDKISRMKSEMVVQEMVRDVDAAYWDLTLGQKQRDAYNYKFKFEHLCLYGNGYKGIKGPPYVLRVVAGEQLNSDNLKFQSEYIHVSHVSLKNQTIYTEVSSITSTDDAVSELADFRAWFDHLSSKCSDANENSSKVTALLAERDFVWNQYKKRESDLTDRLKSKSTEVEQANEKIQKLLASMEILQSSNSEKDRIILKLKFELEEASVKKSEEISKLSRELELLRKGKSASVTPVLRCCSTRSRSNEGNDARNISLKRESHPSQVVEKGCRSSKRTAVEPFPTSETPKLFTSAFKVPKLKNSSPCVI